VIDTIRAWYVLPDIINRPVIVNLWGLTGTGKTQLIRSLSKKLGFYDRLIEVQMDGYSNGGGTSIGSMLSDSAISEGTPGILVLDEFQRFRTVDLDGRERKVEHYMDVWGLLSDGKLPPTSVSWATWSAGWPRRPIVTNASGRARCRTPTRRRWL
jgi:cell division protease FtsH